MSESLYCQEMYNDITFNFPANCPPSCDRHSPRKFIYFIPKDRPTVHLCWDECGKITTRYVCPVRFTKQIHTIQRAWRTGLKRRKYRRAANMFLDPYRFPEYVKKIQSRPLNKFNCEFSYL